jgi:hypothetical protein
VRKPILEWSCNALDTVEMDIFNLLAISFIVGCLADIAVKLLVFIQNGIYKYQNYVPGFLYNLLHLLRRTLRLQQKYQASLLSKKQIVSSAVITS